MRIYSRIAVCLTAAVTAFSFASCKGGDTSSDSSSGGSQTSQHSAKYKDGEYKVSAPTYDDDGYKATVELVVKDGAVYSVSCDADTREKGTKKALSEDGLYGMKAGGAQHEWHEEIALFENYVMSSGVDAVSVDGEGRTNVISGCTIKVADYVDLINEALDKAKE